MLRFDACLILRDCVICLSVGLFVIRGSYGVVHCSDKFLYSYYLFLLHVTQIFPLFISVTCRTDILISYSPYLLYIYSCYYLSLSTRYIFTHTHTHTTYIHTTWKVYHVYLLLVLVTRGVMCTYQSISTHILL